MTALPEEAIRIAGALRSAGTVIVSSHVNPDGDAVGSVLGATLALRSTGIKATPTLADAGPAPATYAFLHGHDTFRSAEGLEAPDVFLALDTPNTERLGLAKDLAEAAGRLVVIDHHPDNQRFGADAWVDSAAAATGQMLWALLPELGVVPTPDIAMCLYVGLMTDTGRFSYGNTDPRALRDAADMVAAGADPFAAYSMTYETRTIGFLHVQAKVMERTRHANGGLVAYSWLTDDDVAEAGMDLAEAENLIDTVRSVGDVEAVFLVKCHDGRCHVSLRAKTDFDVAAVARAFGGGGHRAAAGFTTERDREDTVTALLAALPARDEA